MASPVTPVSAVELSPRACRHIEYWADYICPWCYLALDRVEHLVARHGAVVTWQPYELHPELPAEETAAPRPARPRDVGDYLRAELAAAGLEVAPRTTWCNSSRALALSAWARGRAEWPDLHLALYRAYWVHGASLADPAVLKAAAAGAGIPEADAHAAVAAGVGAELLAPARERAHDLGIAATPGWHFGGGVVLSGAHPREVFDRVMAGR